MLARSRRHGRQIRAVVLGITLAPHLRPVSVSLSFRLASPRRPGADHARRTRKPAIGAARLFAAGVIEPVLLSGYRLNELRGREKGKMKTRRTPLADALREAEAQTTRANSSSARPLEHDRSSAIAFSHPR